MLYREPKLLKVQYDLYIKRASQRVSVLYREPKLLKDVEVLGRGGIAVCFSALP